MLCVSDNLEHPKVFLSSPSLSKLIHYANCVDVGIDYIVDFFHKVCWHKKHIIRRISVMKERFYSKNYFFYLLEFNFQVLIHGVLKVVKRNVKYIRQNC